MAARLSFTMEQEIRIKKAKLANGGGVEIQFIDHDGNKVAMKGYNPCHHDLLFAFAALTPFFADLTEQREADSIDWDNIDCNDNKELLKMMTVTGISIGGDDVNKIITMTGRRALATSRVLNLNAPGVPMNDDAFEWPFKSEFDLAVQALIYEVKEYLLHRKWECEQGTLDFEAEQDDPFAAPAKTVDAPPLDTVA